MNLEHFFQILRDGEWHDLTELANRTGVQTEKLAAFTRFLSDQGIVEYEKNPERMKIDPEWRHLLPIETSTGKSL